MNSLPTLTVAVSTRGRRAHALHAGSWPVEPGVDILLLVQEPEADPALLPALTALAAARPDLTLLPLRTTGLSRSRNAALEAARGDILLVTDDDIIHPPGAYAGIRQAFAADPTLALFVGCSLDPEGRPRKRAISRRPLTRLNAARSSSHEIALRLAPIRARRLRFDEGFGVGAGTPALMGEEYIFLADALAAGLKGRHDPLAVSIHPVESSGFVWEGPAQAQARALVFTRVFGPAAPFMRLAFALKNRRRFASPDDLRVFLRG